MLSSVLLLAAVGSAAAACICPTPVPGDPLCAYQYVLVGKALAKQTPICAAPVLPEGGEIVNFNEFSKNYVNFEVEAVLKQPLLQDSPEVVKGQIVQVWSSEAEEACGYQMEPESSYVINAFKENLDGCNLNRDPEKQVLDLATTGCSENIENPTVFDLIARADECGAEYGVETPEPELREVEAVTGIEAEDDGAAAADTPAAAATAGTPAEDVLVGTPAVEEPAADEVATEEPAAEEEVPAEEETTPEEDATPEQPAAEEEVVPAEEETAAAEEVVAEPEATADGDGTDIEVVDALEDAP